MKRILAERGIRLTKSLGQNFLHDANQLRRIVGAAELTRSDRVLEIGPGLGPLTELLLSQAGEVFAIEKDEKLVQVLRDRFEAGQAPDLSLPQSPAPSGAQPVLHLIHGDALEYLRRQRRDWSQWKLVANLPYSVASPILVELAQSELGPRRMVATLQLEVARRLTALPRQKDYGLLTLLVQLHYAPLGAFKVPASCFFPEPEVDSACVWLARRAPALLPANESAVFSKIVKRAFAQRRKMMLKLLKHDWLAEPLTAAFERLKLSPQVRAEEVSLDQFAGLARALAPG